MKIENRMVHTNAIEIWKLLTEVMKKANEDDVSHKDMSVFFASLFRNLNEMKKYNESFYKSRLDKIR